MIFEWKLMYRFEHNIFIFKFKVEILKVGSEAIFFLWFDLKQMT